MVRAMPTRHYWTAALLLALAACPPAKIPGDENMGLYALHAAPEVLDDAGVGCDIADESIDRAGFDFDATLSRNTGTTDAFITMNGVNREGTWDGQYLYSVATAQRVFQACRDCTTRIEETMHFALLSRSQNDAVGQVCPPSPLDGGVPAPNVDLGITLPGMTPLGFDGIRACGIIATRVLAEGTVDGGACPEICSQCAVRYQLTGVRR